jgi:hypothetical protein
MISEWELWACAEHVVKCEGDNAQGFVQARIEALSRLNDSQGVATWRAIGVRLAQTQGQGS